MADAKRDNLRPDYFDLSDARDMALAALRVQQERTQMPGCKEQ
jgi:hypothetical protein